MAGSVSSNSALRMQSWSNLQTRDAFLSHFFSPLMSRDVTFGTRMPEMADASALKGAIRLITDLSAKMGDGGPQRAGDVVVIPHLPQITGEPVYGDARIQGSGASYDPGSQTMYVEPWAKEVQTPGRQSSLRTPVDYVEAFNAELKNFRQEFLEESILLALWGLTSWSTNGYNPDKQLGTGGRVLGSTIETFDSTTIRYAGDATSDSDIDSSDVLTAQELERLVGIAKSKPSGGFPVEAISGKGQAPTYFFVTGTKGKQQLMADQQFRESMVKVVPSGGDNPIQKWATMGYQCMMYGNICVVEYPRVLYPAANVCRSLLIGADALLAIDLEDRVPSVDPADNGKTRQAITIYGTNGLKANKVGGVRRGCLAIDHYAAAATA